MLTSKLRAAQTALRRRADPHFTWVINASTPWTVPAKPLAESTIALLTTCGLYRVDTQLPFDARNDLGDPSFREIHVGRLLNNLGTARAGLRPCPSWLGQETGHSK